MRDWMAWTCFIAERETIPFGFEPDRQDCVRFMAGAVQALTGRDILHGVAWKNGTGARMQLARIGKRGGLAGCVDAELERMANAHAHRGDIAGVPDEAFGVRLMVIEGATLVGPGDRGLRRLPRSEMTMAWSAGAQ